MSKIRFEWITGKRLIERWNIDLRELHIVIQNGLPVYNPNYKIEDQGPIYNETPNPDYNENPMNSVKYCIEKNNLYDFQILLESAFPIAKTGLTKGQILGNLLFKTGDIENYEKEYELPSAVSPTSLVDGQKESQGPKVKNLRPSQKAKIECRKIAEAIWRNSRKITIADMLNEDEIVFASTKSNGDLYSEKTVRNWIKDLCPNRSPGRPKKKD